jgi:hypothetical protein
MVDSIKITALQDIGANIAYTTLVPVVNMAGTPTTQKSNLQNLGNLILNGAGGSYFARAAQANIALSVANAAQPNITSVGTLTSVTVTGNANVGNIGATQGVFTSVSGSLVTASQPNVTSVGTLTSLTVSGNVNANTIISTANLTIQANTGNANVQWIFGTDGALYWPSSPGAEWAIEPNGNNEFEIHSHTNVVISTDTSNSNLNFTFGNDGSLSFPSNELYISGNTSVLGSPSGVIQTGANIPLVLITDGANSSLDSVWLEDLTDVANSNIAAMYINPSPVAGAVRVVTGSNGANIYIWDFNNTGVSTSPVLTVDDLPSAVAGMRAFVSDANLVPVGNFGAIVGNSGSNTVSVWSDGTNWRIG